MSYNEKLNAKVHQKFTTKCVKEVSNVNILTSKWHMDSRCKRHQMSKGDLLYGSSRADNIVQLPAKRICEYQKRGLLRCEQTTVPMPQAKQKEMRVTVFSSTAERLLVSGDSIKSLQITRKYVVYWRYDPVQMYNRRNNEPKNKSLYRLKPWHTDLVVVLIVKAILW